MNSYQRRIDQFAKDRDWAQFHNPKDLLLGIVEEVSEIRNIVKWEQDPKVLHQVLEDNKAELADNIGDMYWFIALLANQHGINIDEAADEVIKANEKRFPLADTKARHTNRYLGGKDKQYDDKTK
jgi:NTP pyrophosphatase (non-canonical NTP hydrolase)